MFRWISKSSALFAAAVLASMLPTAAAESAGVRSPDASIEPIVVYTRDPARASAAAELLSRAREKSTIRVIVGLDLAMRDENTLTPAQEAVQTRSLRDMQTAVLRRAGLAAEWMVRFEYIPFMSVRIDAPQLRRLLADPQVVFVKESVPLRPALDDSAPLIQAPKLWNKGFTGNGHTVVVIDTGWPGNHDMLKDRVVGEHEVCFSLHDPANFLRVALPQRGRQAERPRCGGELSPGSAWLLPWNIRRVDRRRRPREAGPLCLSRHRPGSPAHHRSGGEPRHEPVALR